MAAGRPTRYIPAYCTLVKKLCKIGATDDQIADFIGIHRDTLYEWKKVHPEFSDALKTAKEDFDEQVEKSLLHRALGYEHPDTKILQHNGVPIVVKTVKHYPPSEIACFFWLQNRQPDKWRRINDQGPAGNEIVAAALKEIAEKLPE